MPLATLGQARPIALVGLCLLLICATGPAVAQPDFPPLTGRVVDNADLLDPTREQALTNMLATHEQATGEQVVVATLAGLQGLPIEDYGYQLGRAWGIGQADEDTGAMLLVAPSERAVRIEVGYGLEGRLTDARSATIINRLVLPAFRNGNFGDGIVAGARAMIDVLGGNPTAVDSVAREGEARGAPSPLRSLGFFVLMIVMIALFGRGRGGRRRRGFFGVPIITGGGFGGGGLGGSGGFGGGGGGSFGGGGASGGW